MCLKAACFYAFQQLYGSSSSAFMYLYCMISFREKGLQTQGFWMGLFLLNPDEGFTWIDGSPVSTYLLDIISFFFL